MAAFNFNQFTDATAEMATDLERKGTAEVNPNFNSQAGTPYQGNFVITSAYDIALGLLWTAHYSVAGPNTITIQFPSPLVSVSTTTSDYTLAGPSAPSITSVVWSAGSREILLNLSGALVSTNTYTLAIGLNKVLSGSQIPYFLPKDGTYNWPGLVVDVILPATIACVGVGIEQDIALGTPSVDNTGSMVMVGIEQDVVLGTPSVTALAAATGVGIEQDAVLGTPDMGLFVTATGVGFSQPIALGTPVAVENAAPVGVGIAQVVALGTPVADINPLTPSGVGISEVILLGNPQASGPADAIGVGIAQLVTLGTPHAVKTNTQDVVGVGVDQPIVLGTPVAQPAATMVSDPFDQPIDLGTPNFSIPLHASGVGVDQPVDFGTPFILAPVPLHASSLGIEVVAEFGNLTVGPPRPHLGSEAAARVDAVVVIAPREEGAVRISTTVEQVVLLLVEQLGVV